MSFQRLDVRYWARLGADLTNKPGVAAYIERMNARPAMQRAWAA
ncbi:MAG: hypothetical protein NT133_21330 [Alphaproteobacteria bacterium]|nr:hypothetical protein [Alphaproteobacteria bacterium]